MGDSAYCVLRLPAAGGCERLPVPAPEITQEMLAALLQTDVTERMRMPVMPDGLADSAVLCYFIDARGGERGLQANFPGTCFYHTGCPIFGDLVLALCDRDSDSAVISALDPQQADLLTQWLHAQLPAYL